MEQGLIMPKKYLICCQVNEVLLIFSESIYLNNYCNVLRQVVKCTKRIVN